MNDSTKKLAINAAFFHDIKEDREELHFIESRLKYLLAQPELFKNSLKELQELTEVLRDQLGLHFALEEAYGYFEEAIEVEPRLHRSATTLRAQHSELYELSQQLCDATVREPAFEPDILAEKATSLLAALDEHEHAEAALIQSALNDDVGGGD